jgi:general secretion pathway protein J
MNARRTIASTRYRAKAFSLLELLVALAVFAALAAAAYGGLAEIARARGAIAERQDRLAAIVRAVSTFERDLRQAVSRPVRGGARGAIVPALAGAADRIELTRLGFANPRAGQRAGHRAGASERDCAAASLSRRRQRMARSLAAVRGR